MKSKRRLLLSTEDIELAMDGVLPEGTPDAAEPINVDEVPEYTASDAIEEADVREEAVTTVSELDETSNDIQVATEALFTLRLLQEVDKAKLAKGEFSKEDLKESISAYKEVCATLGIDSPKKLDNLSSESSDLSTSLEALDGERNGFIDRIKKMLGNAKMAFKDDLSAWDDIKADINKFDVSKIATLKKAIESGERIPSKEFKGNIEGINKKLAIFYAMGNNSFSVKALIDHLEIPHNLIVKDKLYTVGCVNVYKQLIKYAAPDHRDVIHPFEPAIKVLDTFNVPEIRKWVSKDTLVGFISNVLGDSVMITSVRNTETHGQIIARKDRFEIPDNMYTSKPIKALTKQEMITLLDYALTLKDKGVQAEREADKILNANTYEGWLELLINTLIALIPYVGIATVPRLLTFFYANRYWLSGLEEACSRMTRSYLEMPQLILSIVNGSLEKGKSEAEE